MGLQYELISGQYWVGAADGTRADWYRNILADPSVELQVGGRKFGATAEAVSDTQRIAAYLAYRLKKRPLMMRLILRMDGARGPITPDTLREYAANIRLVVITPQES